MNKRYIIYYYASCIVSALCLLPWYMISTWLYTAIYFMCVIIMLAFWKECEMVAIDADFREVIMKTAELLDFMSAKFTKSNKEKEINQCDGCIAGIPVDKNGSHRMGSGKYPDYMRCQKHRYVKETSDNDQTAADDYLDYLESQW